VSLGAYGLTQAIFQVPFGILGDLRGRRLVVLLSLLVFAVGSAIVALGHTILAVLVGRLVQGVGAMASTLIALIGDGTRDRVRTRGMALMGLVLGVSFALGFLLGPLVSSRFGVPWVFGASAVLALAAVLLFEVLVATRLVPHVVRGHRPRPGAPGSWSWAEARSLLQDRSLLILDGGIFVLHAAVTGLFVVVPAARLADRPARARLVLFGGTLLVMAGLVVLAAFHHSVTAITFGLGLFVVGFAAIEPLLAALLTRYTGRGARGRRPAARARRRRPRLRLRPQGTARSRRARRLEPARGRSHRGGLVGDPPPPRLARGGARGRLDGGLAGARPPLARSRHRARARGAVPAV
jgi:MFS family permease